MALEVDILGMALYFTKDVMSKDFVHLSQNSPIEEVLDIFAKNQKTGVIITDDSPEKKILGTITFSDLLISGTNIYLPTIFEVLKSIPVYGGDIEAFREHFKNIFGLKAKDIMNKKPVFLLTNDLLQQALKLFVENEKLNLILVSDPFEEKLEGIITRESVLHFYYKFYYEYRWEPPEKVGKEIEGEKEEKLKKLYQELGKFSLVTKIRTRYWFFLTLIFIIVGILITLFFILKVVLK